MHPFENLVACNGKVSFTSLLAEIAVFKRAGLYTPETYLWTSTVTNVGYRDGIMLAVLRAFVLSRVFRVLSDGPDSITMQLRVFYTEQIDIALHCSQPSKADYGPIANTVWRTFDSIVSSLRTLHSVNVEGIGAKPFSRK